MLIDTFPANTLSLLAFSSLLLSFFSSFISFINDGSSIGDCCLPDYYGFYVKKLHEYLDPLYYYSYSSDINVVA